MANLHDEGAIWRRINYVEKIRVEEATNYTASANGFEPSTRASTYLPDAPFPQALDRDFASRSRRVT
jgi:hypothetical protein